MVCPFPLQAYSFIIKLTMPWLVSTKGAHWTTSKVPGAHDCQFQLQYIYERIWKESSHLILQGHHWLLYLPVSYV